VSGRADVLGAAWNVSGVFEPARPMRPQPADTHQGQRPMCRAKRPDTRLQANAAASASISLASETLVQTAQPDRTSLLRSGRAIRWYQISKPGFFNAIPRVLDAEPAKLPLPLLSPAFNMPVDGKKIDAHLTKLEALRVSLPIEILSQGVPAALARKPRPLLSLPERQPRGAKSKGKADEQSLSWRSAAGRSSKQCRG